MLDSLSLRELSRTVGVTPTAAYRHFRDKEALLEQLTIQGFEELRQHLRERGMGRSAGLAGLAEAYRSFAHRHPALMELMFRPRRRARGGSMAVDEAIGECLADFVAAAATESNATNPEAAITLAVRAWSAVHGFAMLAEVNAFGALDQWMLPSPTDLVATSRATRS